MLVSIVTVCYVDENKIAGAIMISVKSTIRLLGSAALAAVALSALAADLPPLPAGLTAIAKPVHMPAFNLPTPAGGAVKADEFRDKVVIARFWATW
jgi:hypothetical protein